MSRKCDKLIDGISFCGKFFLILRHDISRIHFRIKMQIPGASRKLPPGSFYTFQGEIKEGFVIGLKFHMSAAVQNLPVAGQIFGGSQSDRKSVV